jgi:hypothetical protein
LDDNELLEPFRLFDLGAVAACLSVINRAVVGDKRVRTRSKQSAAKNEYVDFFIQKKFAHGNDGSNLVTSSAT